MLRSEPMTKTLLCLIALLILTGCRSTARIKATPLKEQNATQVAADRKKCDEWSKSAGSVLTGYASCLVAGSHSEAAPLFSTPRTLHILRGSGGAALSCVLTGVLQRSCQALLLATRGSG